MGIRFRKSVNLGGGFRLNLSKSGMGVSFGRKGARVSVGPRGVTRSAGIPGTGVYYTKTTSLKPKPRAEQSGARSSNEAEPPKASGGAGGVFRRILAVLCFIVALFLFLAGIPIFPLGILLWGGAALFVFWAVSLLKKVKKELGERPHAIPPALADTSDIFSPEPLPLKTELTAYQVHAKNKTTNHFRTVQISAESRERCEALAAGQDLIPPYEIEEVPPRAPSERQLDYARELKIAFPEDVTFDEISDLLDRRLKGDRQAPKVGLAEFALSHGIHFSRFIGKNSLYDLVFSNLQGRDKIAFFAFCVYRWLSDDRISNLDTHEHRDLFYSFADENLSNESFVKSVNHYAGSSIKFFGEIRSGGSSFDGGSTNTIAYKTASEYLCKSLGLQERKSKVLTSDL